MCVNDRHYMTLAVKVALNPNTTNQPIKRQNFGLDRIENICRRPLHCFKNDNSVCDREEKNAEKGENTGNQHFLLFPHCFPKAPSEKKRLWKEKLC